MANADTLSRTGHWGVALVPEGVDQVEAAVRAVLRDALGISAERVAAFDATTPLFGSLPELDSMAVVGVINLMEERFDFFVEDDEIDGATFATVGTLVEFIQGKLG